MSLSPEEQRYLLGLARESISRAVRNEDLPPIDADTVPKALQNPGASFVTLNRHGCLRGCIGSLEARRPLALDVQQNAIGAALRDPRFPPIGPEEVEDLTIEISVLSLPEPVRYDNADELLDSLRAGVDGVVVERGWHRATFLPQVWEKVPNKGEFLDRLCLKAGLPPNAYCDGEVEVSTYQVQKFREGQVSSEPQIGREGSDQR